MVFILDVFLPRRIVAAGLYVVLVFGSMWLPLGVSTVVGAVVGTTLTLPGVFFSPPLGPLWISLGNAAISVLAIWLIVAIVLQRKQCDAHLQRAHEALEHRVDTRTAELRATAETLHHAVLKPQEAEIENARLYKTLERRAARLQTLSHLNQLISASLDMDAVLRKIAKQQLSSWMLCSCGSGALMRVYAH